MAVYQYYDWANSIFANSSYLQENYWIKTKNNHYYKINHIDVRRQRISLTPPSERVIHCVKYLDDGRADSRYEECFDIVKIWTYKPRCLTRPKEKVNRINKKVNTITEKTFGEF